MRNLTLLYVYVILFGVLQFYYYFILKNIIVYLFLKGKWETQKKLVLPCQVALP